MRINLIGLAVTIWLGGCSSSAPGVAEGDASAANDGQQDGADSPALRALDWVLGALNGATLTEAEVAARFAPAFLQQVPPAQLIAVLGQLASAGPYTLVRVEGPVTDAQLVGVVTDGGQHYGRITIAADAAGLVQGLLLQSAGDLDPTFASWEAIDQAVSALAPKVNILAATVDEAGCTPIHALAADASLAMGSSFKLWILATLAQEIGAGTRAWNDQLAITDAHKSLPSGVLQDQPAGIRLSLLAFANNMISISDNTAADHLLFFLGRPAVEAMLTTTGHHDPTLNQPFLGTRELFNLKLMVTPTEQQAYLAADIPGRRAQLETFDTTYDPRTYQGPPWESPRTIDTLEWFATPGDLCNVMRALKVAGDQPATAPVYNVLAINPGIPDPTGAFSYIGFKGGSEPGVMNLTWLLRRQADAQWLFFTITFNDPDHPIDEAQAAYLTEAARAQLSRP
jgi:hypothetical protein